jgi:hypothetical protein
MQERNRYPAGLKPGRKNDAKSRQFIKRIHHHLRYVVCCNKMTHSLYALYNQKSLIYILCLIAFTFFFISLFVHMKPERILSILVVKRRFLPYRPLFKTRYKQRLTFYMLINLFQSYKK